jgi:TolB protein
MCYILSKYPEHVLMQKIIKQTLFIVLTLFSFNAHAILTMELTRGIASAIPITVEPFTNPGNIPQDVSGIVSSDLQNSGRFKVSGSGSSADYAVTGKVEALGGDRYQVSFQLHEKLNGKESENSIMSKNYTVSSKDLRAAAHHISDLVFKQITGIRGVFSTRVVYVVVQRAFNTPGVKARYVLEVADQDGYNPRPLLNSPEPIMSPSWAPDGRRIAYESFEKKQASIYQQDVVTGQRTLISSYPGINNAPSWSPNGQKLALVLSKSGAPNIYILNIGTQRLTQVTHDFYNNTEPSWAPDGKSLLFTSDRSGGPQIYQVNLASGSSSRLTFDGDYNARASFAPDGQHVAMIHRVDGVYKIAMLDLDSGMTKVLTSSAGDSASPSIAPNGDMLLYDTVAGGKNVLGMVSADGRIQLVLPARNGAAQDPAWSPFL